MGAPASVASPARPAAEYAQLIDGARRFARVMDRLVGIPGSEVGVGLDALIGAILPVVGDAAGGLASLYLVVQALRARVPLIVIARMLLYIGLDALIGVVPVVGDIADVFFQSNRYSLALIEKHAGGRASTRGDWLFVGVTVGVGLVLAAAPVAALTYLGLRLFHH
jgi:hypothetical protein